MSYDRLNPPMPDQGKSSTASSSGVYRDGVEFRVLGPLEVTQDGSPVSLGGSKQRTVLALLLASNGRPVSTDYLIEGVYGDEASDAVRRSIQTFISNLRGLCGEVIERRGDGYVLNVDPNAVDASRFEEAVAMARLDEDPSHAAEFLRDVLALWRGYPYADVDAHGLLEPDVARLTEARLVALGSRVEADLAAGRHTTIVSELASLSREYPLREQFRAQHMVALYRAGRQAEALRACEMTRSYLAEEIGIDLSAELRSLEQRILEQDPSLAYQSSTEVRRFAVLAADVADSSSLARLDPEQRKDVVEAQERIINDAAVGRSGRVFAHRGSAIYASFATVQSAVDAAAIIQQDLAAANLPEAGVGVAIDIGDVEARIGGDVTGPPVNRTSALVGAAHGGQVVLSTEAHRALTADGAAGWVLRGLGRHSFEGLGSPQVVYQLVLPGHVSDFPELRTDSAPAPLPRSARGIPGYELRAEIGSGPFGVVHRAYQSSMGREVAVKIIQPAWANRPEFLRRFEVEAQLVARLEHPHIVPLYDYWRDPTGAFLVMRLMRGGALDQRIFDRPLTVAETGELLWQLGPALSAAHRSGVVHGDIKPSNVLFDEDGNAYLSDFGIVTGFHGGADSHELSVGQSISSDGPSVHGDVGSLGLLVQQCLTGSIARENGEIPPRIVDVLDRAMASDADVRYGDVDEFMAAWESAAGAADSQPVPEQRSDARNPYKGLRAFDEPDADDFYGRDRLIARLADAVDTNRLVTAIGPSGIGKSSVVKAGLVPALRRGAVPGSDEWLITTMTPGRDVFGELAAALTRVSVLAIVDLEETLRSGPRSLVRSVHRLLPTDTPLLLIIDQFEELFTLTDSEEDRAALLDLLLATATAEDSTVRIVLTMRADYMDRPLRYAGFGELMREGIVLISAPSDDELRAIVEEPARSVGVHFEAGLVDRIVDGVKGQPGGLPLLQFTMAELFDQRQADLLTMSAYEQAGGVLETISRRAEDLYQDLDATSQETARQLFLRLVTVSETRRDTRRRVSVTELHRLGISDDAVTSVLDDFGRHRILTFDRDPVTRAPTVEVAHEAILSEWTRFGTWIEDHREDLLLHRRLTAAIGEWDESERDAGYLLSGGRLEHFETWAADTDMVITATERDFLTASREQQDEARARRSQRRRWILTGFAGVAAIALLLAVAAFYQSSLRASEAAVNHARELAAGAMANLDSDPELSTLLALEAMSVTPEPQREAVEALHAAVLTSRSEFAVAWPEDLPYGMGLAIAATPDGMIAFTGDAGTIMLHDADTGSLVGRLESDADAPDGWTPLDVPAIDANPQGGEIAAVGADRMVRVFRPLDGRVVWSGSVAADSTAESGGPVAGKAFYSPGGQWLAVVTDEGPPVLSMWNAATGERLWLQELTELRAPVVASFSPSGDELAIAWWQTETVVTGEIVVLDRATGTELRRVDPGVSIQSLEWGPDGTRIYHGSETGALMVWDADSLESVAVRTAHGNNLADLEFSPDGSLLATGGADGIVKIWTVDPLETILTLPAATTTMSVAFAPDSRRVFAGGADSIVRSWDIRPQGRGELWAAAPTGMVGGLDIDPAGSSVIAHSIAGRFNPGGATVWDADTGNLRYDIDGLNHFSWGGVTYLPAGDRFAIQRVEYVIDPDTEEGKFVYGPIQIRKAEDGTVLVDLVGSEGADRQQLSVSPNGRYLASGGTEDVPATEDQPYKTGSASIYDTETGRLLHRLPLPDWAVIGTAFSADGSTLATGSCGLGSLRIWDWENELLLNEVPHSECMTSAAFSPTEGLVAVTSYGTPPLVWNVDADQEAYVLEGHAGGAFGVDFSPDGKRIATAGADGTLRIWDAADGTETLTIQMSAASLQSARFYPNGDRVVVSSIDGNLWVVTLDPDDLADIARDRLTRGLTAGECTRYHVDSCSEG